MHRLMAVVTLVTMLGQAGEAWAQTGNDGTLAQAGYGAGSFLGTLVYTPLKATFCILGGLGSAVALAAGPDTAAKVAGASCGGTWVITPAVVKGREEVHFVGATQGTSRRLAERDRR
ncbi:MAG: hypothetical protein HYV93_13300 [Candidatus Rokubacteria bacterium]|nr:hypothetical protein [Candidatus Rokubacteria bacterium]